MTKVENASIMLGPHPESQTRNAANKIGRHCERSEAIHPLRAEEWIASSLSLLAMTPLDFHFVDGFFSQALRSREAASRRMAAAPFFSPSILRDAAKRPLLRMRSPRSLIEISVICLTA